MSYRLSLSAPVPDALRAAATEQLEDAARALRDPGDDLEGAVHSARKDLKKTRSLLRLARPGMPGKAYRAENARLREIARSISGARDADVMLATFDALAERAAGRVPEPAIATLRTHFAEADADARSGGDASVPDDVVPALEAAIEGVATWPLDDCDGGTLVAGAARAYARGKRDLKVAAQNPSVENMHEWRKRAKDLWYHMRLLRDLHPDVLNAEATAAHALADLLGDDHDLAVLRPVLDEASATVAADLTPLIDVLEARREELQAEAFALGRRIYARRPADFAAWLDRLMRVTTGASVAPAE